MNRGFGFEDLYVRVTMDVVEAGELVEKHCGTLLEVDLTEVKAEVERLRSRCTELEAQLRDQFVVSASDGDFVHDPETCPTIYIHSKEIRTLPLKTPCGRCGSERNVYKFTRVVTDEVILELYGETHIREYSCMSCGYETRMTVDGCTLIAHRQQPIGITYIGRGTI